jgi:hypothetical protein
VANGALGATERERSDFYGVTYEHERECGERYEEAGVPEPPVGCFAHRVHCRQAHEQQQQRNDRHEPIKGGCGQVGQRPKLLFVQIYKDRAQREQRPQ